MIGQNQEFRLLGFTFGECLVASLLGMRGFPGPCGVDRLGLLPAALLGFLPSEGFELPSGGDHLANVCELVERLLNDFRFQHQVGDGSDDRASNNRTHGRPRAANSS